MSLFCLSVSTNVPFPLGLYNARASPYNLPVAFEWPRKYRHVRSSVVELQCSVIPTVLPTQTCSLVEHIPSLWGCLMYGA
jgi:hypothetical protein